MAYSSTKSTGDGVTTDFPVTFDYLDQDHVKVRVDKVFTTEVGSLYKATWLNSTTLRVDTVSGNNPAPNGAVIEFIRETPIDVPAVVFGGGASLSSENLNKNSEYLTFALQEASDTNQEFTKLYLGAFAVAPTTDNDGDALQVGAVYYSTTSQALFYWTGSEWIIGESTIAAQTFATAAEAARDAAAASQVAAAASQVSAAASQSAASTSASSASTSASNASASATAAASSASTASAAATSATGSAATASTQATSAATLASSASASASAASASATAAAGSASDAASSAALSAATASYSEDRAIAAETSASNAAASEAAAAASLRAIGEPFALWDHIVGCPIPSNSGAAKFIRLTAGQSGVGGYNEGLISGESVSGSSPDIVATATISVGPMAGQTVRLINTTAEFLRPGTTSGVLQDDEFKSHTHGAFFAVAGASGGAVGVASDNGSSFQTSATGGTETRPRNISGTFYLRIV